MSAQLGAHVLEEFLRDFWARQVDSAETSPPDSLKDTILPLARIKKVMKMDPDVKMISSDAPLLLSKACEIFIAEVTSRAWKLAELNKRRTLQRVDVAGAVGQSDQFDFLIDIIPREDIPKHQKTKTRPEVARSNGHSHSVVAPTQQPATYATQQPVSEQSSEVPVNGTAES